MSCAEWAIRREVGPALPCFVILAPYPGQAVPQQWWHLSATYLCGTLNSCSHQTCPAHHEQVRELWGQFGSHVSIPSCLIFILSCWLTLISGAVCPWCSLVEFCCVLGHRRIESYLDCALEESSFKSVWFVLISLSKYYGKVSLGQIKTHKDIV